MNFQDRHVTLSRRQTIELEQRNILYFQFTGNNEYKSRTAQLISCAILGPTKGVKRMQTTCRVCRMSCKGLTFQDVAPVL